MNSVEVHVVVWIDIDCVAVWIGIAGWLYGLISLYELI